MQALGPEERVLSYHVASRCRNQVIEAVSSLEDVLYAIQFPKVKYDANKVHLSQRISCLARRCRV